MDLRQLRHFLAVVEHGSILRAAGAVHLTQPALSRSIQALEASLDARLFERGRRGIEPTPHGLVLARHAERLVAQAEQAVDALRGLGDAATTRLAIGVGTHLAGLVVPRLVARLLERVPRLRVSLIDGSGEALAAALRRGEIDVALCAAPVDGVPPDLRFTPLLVSDLAVVCRAAHPLARRRRVALAELASRRWALAERPRAIAQTLRLAFANAGLALPDPVVRSTSLTFLRGLLLETDLISLLPVGLVRAELDAGSLVRLRAELPGAATRVGVLRRDDQLPAVAAFVAALRADLRATAPVRRPARTPRRR